MFALGSVRLKSSREQVLTLVSNERIPLTAAMRMIFEIHSLKNATPATVSRAGILFVNEVGARRVHTKGGHSLTNMF